MTVNADPAKLREVAKKLKNAGDQIEQMKRQALGALQSSGWNDRERQRFEADLSRDLKAASAIARKLQNDYPKVLERKAQRWTSSAGEPDQAPHRWSRRPIERGAPVTRVSPEALMRIDTAIRGWAETAEGVSRQAAALTKRLADDAQEEVRQKTRRVSELEAALRKARGEAREAIESELLVATPALERARRGLRLATEAQRSAQGVGRRIGESTGSRVPGASADLRRRMAALAAYSGGGHAYARLAGMVTRAVASHTVDMMSQASDQVTSHMPDHVGEPLSTGLVLGNEVKNNWALYSHTPEIVALNINNLIHRK